MTYLEFSTLDDFLEHLRTEGIPECRLGYGDLQGPADKRGVRAVRIYAVATALLPNHLALVSVPIGDTTNVFLTSPDEQTEKFRESTRRNFEAVRRRIQADGIDVLPGIWSFEAPKILKDD